MKFFGSESSIQMMTTQDRSITSGCESQIVRCKNRHIGLESAILNPINIWSEIPEPKAIDTVARYSVTGSAYGFSKYLGPARSWIQSVPIVSLKRWCSLDTNPIDHQPNQFGNQAATELLVAIQKKRSLIHGVLILIEPVANYNLLISVTTHLTSLSGPRMLHFCYILVATFSFSSVHFGCFRFFGVRCNFLQFSHCILQFYDCSSMVLSSFWFFLCSFPTNWPAKTRQRRRSSKRNFQTE